MNSSRLGMIILAGAIFGSATVGSRLALRDLPPLALVGVQLSLASTAFLVTLAALRRKIPTDFSTLRDLAILGVMYTTLPSILFTLGLQWVSSGLFTILVTLGPLITAIFSHFVLANEKLSLLMLIGLLISMGGVALIILTGTTGLTEGESTLKGPLLVLVGLTIGSAGLVWLRLRLAHLDSLVVSGVQVSFAWLATLPVILATTRLNLAEVGWQSWLGVGYQGVIGTYIGFRLAFEIARRYGATAASLPGYIMPVAATLLGGLLLGEIVTLPMLAGGVLVVGGVFMANRVPPQAAAP